MMKPLRKRHLQIWMLWAFLLPAGIITAWLSIPGQPEETLLQSKSIEPLEHITATIEKEDYTVHLRSNHEKNRWQLEWINKKVLTVPTATIYQVEQVNDPVEKGILLGRIEARGNYFFNLSDSSVRQLNLVLFDFIHKQIIDQIKLP